MKKYALIFLALLVVAGGAGAVWYKYFDVHNPLGQAQVLLDRGDTRGAAIELRNAVRREPNNPEAHYRLGQVQMQLGDPVAAEKELNMALSLGNKSPYLPVLLAQSYLQQGHASQLLATFKDPLSTPEMTAQMLIMRAFAQLSLNDLTAAQATVDEAARIAPTVPNVPLAASRIAIARGDMVVAEQQANIALSLAPGRSDLLLLKGQVLNAKGDRRGALEQLDAALKANPRNTAARLEHGNVLLVMNEDARAKVDVDQVLAEQPNAAPAIYLQAVLFTRANDFAAADIAFTRINTFLIRYPRALYFNAIVKFNLGQVEQATDSATRYAARNPGDIEGVKLLGRILLATGRGDRALDVLQKAVKDNIADAEVLDLLGRAYAVAGKPIQAAQTFDKAVAMAPQNAEILSHLASVKLGLGDATGAANDYARSLQMLPSQPNAAESLVVAALASGDVDRAEAALANLRAQAGNTETVGMLNGTVLMMKQNLTGARAQFEELLRANPKQTNASLGLAKVLLLQSRPADAEQALNTVLEREPANEGALTTLLQILLNTNRTGRAVAVLEAAFAAAPNNPALPLALSDLYVRAGTPEKALTLLAKVNKGITTPPAPMLAARARAQLAAGHTQESQDDYRAVLALTPGDMDVMRQLVALELDARDWESARSTLRDALGLRPGDVELLRLLVGVDLQATGETAAFGTIARLRSDPVNQQAARTLTADLLFYNKHYREAAEAYAAELKAQPTSRLVQSTANAYFAAGLPSLAADTLRRWLAQNPNDADALRTLGTFEITGHNLDTARGMLERLLELQPGDPVGLNNLALLYQQQHDERALPLARRAFLRKPSPQAADTLGWILNEHGDTAGALTLLTSAAAALQSEPSVQFHYAQALANAGRTDEAIAILKPLAAQLALFDEQVEARRLLAKLQPAK